MANYDYRRYDHTTYTLPLWQGDTVYNETVMFVGNSGVPLLYKAEKIIAVLGYDLKTEYVEGEDYLLKDGKLYLTENTRIPVFSEKDFYPTAPEKGKYLGCSLEGKPYIYHSEGSDIFKRQVHVTYTHSDKWDGNIPEYSAKLERFRQKVASGQPVTVLFYGDSITTGLNSSGKVGCEPYADTWCNMFVRALAKTYGNRNINVVNMAVSGKNIDWAIDNLKWRAIDRKADLMVLAFGMNDAEKTPEEFCSKLGQLLNTFSTACPECDVAVVSTTVPNVETTNVFSGNQPYFEEKMIELCVDLEHTDIVPMTSVHKYLLSKKRFFDMTGNNVNHPNDFLARAYAHTIIKTVIGEQREIEIKEYHINGRKIPDYVITYEQRSIWAKRIAYKLRSHILDTFGVRLEIFEEKCKEASAQISIGFTEGMDIKVYEHEYVIAVFGDRMSVAARGAFAYEEAEKYLFSEIFAEGKRELYDGELISCDIRDTVKDTRRFAYQRQGDYRLLSANICGSYGRKEPNPKAQAAYRYDRLQYFKETVLEYLPDFIGFQECGKEWRELPTFVNRFLPLIGYREVRCGQNDSENFNPIYYRAEKFSVVDCGWHIYSGANNSNSKSYTWAVFRDKKTGTKIGAFSTHYYYTGDEIGRETRKQNSRELCQGIREASKKYCCSFVGCGDFNSTVAEPPHDILRENKMLNAYDIAEQRSNIGSCHEGPGYDVETEILTTQNDYDTSPEFRKYVIDHVYVYGGRVAVKLLDIPISETALLTTDHTLVLSDFSVL